MPIRVSVVEDRLELVADPEEAHPGARVRAEHRQRGQRRAGDDVDRVGADADPAGEREAAAGRRAGAGRAAPARGAEPDRERRRRAGRRRAPRARAGSPAPRRPPSASSRSAAVAPRRRRTSAASAGQRQPDRQRQEDDRVAAGAVIEARLQVGDRRPGRARRRTRSRCRSPRPGRRPRSARGSSARCRSRATTPSVRVESEVRSPSKPRAGDPDRQQLAARAGPRRAIAISRSSGPSPATSGRQLAQASAHDAEPGPAAAVAAALRDDRDGPVLVDADQGREAAVGLGGDRDPGVPQRRRAGARGRCRPGRCRRARAIRSHSRAGHAAVADVQARQVAVVEGLVDPVALPDVEEGLRDRNRAEPGADHARGELRDRRDLLDRRCRAAAPRSRPGRRSQRGLRPAARRRRPLRRGRQLALASRRWPIARSPSSPSSSSIPPGSAAMPRRGRRINGSSSPPARTSRSTAACAPTRPSARAATPT